MVFPWFSHGFTRGASQAQTTPVALLIDDADATVPLAAEGGNPWENHRKTHRKMVVEWDLIGNLVGGFPGTYDWIMFPLQ